MLNTNDNENLVFRILLLLCITSFLFVIFFGYAYVNNPSQMLESAKTNAIDQAKDASLQIDLELRKIKPISESIANDLTTGELEKKDIVNRLKETLEDNPKLFGAGVAFKPYKYNSTQRLYAPYYKRNLNRSLQLDQIEEMYDYTLPDGTDGVRTNWYHRTLDEGPIWIEPYFGSAAQTLLVNYEVPFYITDESGQKVPIGVVGTEYSLDGIRQLVGSLDLGDTGYGFIISKKGNVITHPIQEYLGQNLTDLQKTDETLRQISNNTNQKEQQVIHNVLTGQTLWIFYEPIPSTEWTLGVVFVEDEIIQRIETSQRQKLITTIVAAILFLFFLSILLFRAYRGNPNDLWTVAIFFSILCIFGMIFIWHLALEDRSEGNNQDVMVLDNVGLETALHNYLPYSDNKQNRILVPTGVFLQSLEFSSANNVIVTGYIWQNYSGIPDAVSQGFIFPEAEQISIEEAYSDRDVIGWYFRSVLRQPFDYSKYPFDQEDVWIRLWPGDFHSDIILIPDLYSYDIIQPATKPGIEHDFVLEGWEIQDSYFSYRNNSYNTNFGIKNDKFDGYPELYFNIGTKRNFMSSFMSDSIPIIVVSLLLFAVLMISTKNETKISGYGFSSSTVLTYCAALFFVLIVSHVSLRQKLATDGIIYLEYFYFVLYLAILAVSINSILLAPETGHKIIHYKDNLFIKLLYWPFISGLILGITLFVFY
jgi:hypothetical protein